MADNTTGAMQEFGSSRGPAAASGPRAGLLLLYAEDYLRLPAIWLLDAERTLIGRDQTADLQIPVTAVSRRHAEISWEGSCFVLRDLGSRNGTLLDGGQITEAALEHASEVRIGDAILKFVEKHAEAYVGYRIDGSMLDSARLAKRETELVGGYLMDRVAAEVERIAPAGLSVMLLGESGTGKEVAARELHRLSGRRGGFCAINCAAIPGSLIESELFGYKRGAFSGAERDKPGLFRAAHEGSLLLDEIGDMPLEAQAKLLRVLQSKEVFPLGATMPERVDVRIICATHRDLWRLQKLGTFREDLFARLNEYQLRLIPLRERKEDVYMLVRAFLLRHGRPELQTSFKFMTGLLHYDWPYNVRELEACIKRCIALCDGGQLDEQHLPDAVREAVADYGQRLDLVQSEQRASAHAELHAQPPGLRHAPPNETELRALLDLHQGNIAAVGRELGRARMQVHRWMKRYGIAIEEYR
jgi:transcriptional regulator with PAS, ATPase and Fis domain